MCVVGEGSRLDWSFITKSLFRFEHSAWYLMYGRYLINIYRGILSEWVVAQRTFNIPSLSSSTISLTRLEPSIMGNTSIKSQLGSHVKGTKSQSPPLYSCYLFVRMVFLCVCLWGKHMHVGMSMRVEARGQLQVLFLGSHLPLLCWVRFSS